MTRVAYLGNFRAPYCTEVHVAASLEALGAEVVRLQEGDVPATEVPDRARGCDLFLWTQTYPLAVQMGSIQERWAMLRALAGLGIPTAGFHLDRWWGLGREDQISSEPFFGVDHLFTADGGHDMEWHAAGIPHTWTPPAIYHAEAAPGRVQSRYRSDIAFVGAWRGGYHPEWDHRPLLMRHLARQYRRRCRFWPQRSSAPVRGAALQDLYASVRVLVGDSCLAGGATRYWSDRIPETLGRRGFLLHPYVEGIEEHFTDGKHLRLWPLGDFAELDRLIAYYLEHEAERQAIAEEGWRHVLENHTYKHRMEAVVSAML